MEKTVTPAVIEANRANAQRSTGPKTDAGKEVVKNNALKHGLLTKTLAFENEEAAAEFQSLCGELESDLKPEGALEKMLAEDIAVSWWKLRTVHGLQLQELNTRQGTAAELLKTFASNAELMDGYVINKPRSLGTGACFGWECKEFSVRSQSSKSKEQEDTILGATEGGGRMVFEAKLGNAAESLVRYENLWKKNLYRAIEKLHELQAQRRTENKQK